jgi:hypothetical protein
VHMDSPAISPGAYISWKNVYGILGYVQQLFQTKSLCLFCTVYVVINNIPHMNSNNARNVQLLINH